MLLLPPDIDLEHVSQFNEHGRALVTLIQSRDSKIPERHHTLILGLFAVYNFLISLGQLDTANVSWPPHSHFRRQDWLDIGFAPEVVDILELLPYGKDEVIYYEQPAHIAPDAPFLTYLGKGDSQYRGIIEIPEFLSPEDFLVTGNSRCMFGPRNFYYLYKSKDGVCSAAPRAM
jgi:hypothetical protein